jgi:hypothetical protein
MLFDKLSRKRNTEFYGKRVGPGWLKYEWSGSVWNLDDGTFQIPPSLSVNLTEPPQIQIILSSSGDKTEALILPPSI